MSFLLCFIWCIQCIVVCTQSTANNTSTVPNLESSGASTFTPAYDNSSIPNSETFASNVSSSDSFGLKEASSIAGYTMGFHTSSENAFESTQPYLISLINLSSLHMLSQSGFSNKIDSTIVISSHMSLTSSISPISSSTSQYVSSTGSSASVNVYPSSRNVSTSNSTDWSSLNKTGSSLITSGTAHPFIFSTATATSLQENSTILGGVDVSASFSHMTSGSISETVLSSATGQDKDEASVTHGTTVSDVSYPSTVPHADVSPSPIETRSSMTFSTSEESVVETTGSAEATSVSPLIVTASNVLDTLVASSPMMKTVLSSFTPPREEQTRTSHLTSSPMSVIPDTVSTVSIIDSSSNTNLFETHVTNYTVNSNEPVSSTYPIVIPTSNILPVSELESIHVSETDITYSQTFTIAVSSEVIRPTPHSSFIVEVSTHVNYGIAKTYRVMLSFEGSCGRLEHSDQLKIEFLKALVDIIRNFVPEITDNDFELSQLICNPFKVELLLKNIRDDDCLSQLSFSVRNLTVNVPIIDRTIINYHAVGIQVLSVNTSTNNGREMTKHGLDTSDIVVIVTSTLLFAFLIFLGGIVICRECYKRKRAASFNLLDVPHVNLKLDDFTLTRIPRPTMTYFDNRAKPIVTNGRHRQDNGDGMSRNDGEQNVKLNSDNIRVRMRDHSDGIVIGVTCSPMTNEATSPTSDTSSPCTPCMDQSEQTLLTYGRSGEGTLNPNYNVDDEVIPHNEVCIQEHDKEEIQFL